VAARAIRAAVAAPAHRCQFIECLLLSSCPLRMT
jgi:hypothetical protein